MENTQYKNADGYDIGTWHFLKAGWWVLHIIAITGVFYAGWLFGSSIFR